MTNIRSCQSSYSDISVKLGYGLFTGLNGTFSGTAYVRGNRLQQGSASGTFGRNPNEGSYGYAYALYDVTGTFTVGTANVLDPSGNVLGTFTITATGIYAQGGEALAVEGGTTFVNMNYGIYWSKPAQQQDRFIDIQLINCHMAYFKSAVKADGLATFGIGAAFNCQPSSTAAAGSVAIDITNINTFNINGATASSNGVANCTFLKLSNALGGNISDLSLLFFTTPINIGLGCTYIAINDNVGCFGCGLIVNSSSRRNAAHPDGNVFRNNGAIGTGVDQDDLTRRSWAPVVSASSGSTTFTTSDSWYVLCNGILTGYCQVTYSSRGTANGSLIVNLPFVPSQPVNHAIANAIRATDATALYAPISGNKVYINQAVTGASAFFKADGATPWDAADFSVSFCFPVEVD